MWGELARSLQHANGYVITIVVLGFLAIVVFFERLIMLQFVYHIDFKKFLTNLKKMIAAEDLGRAISFCKSVSRTSFPQIATRAMEAAETDPTTVKGVIEEETLNFIPRVESRVGILPALAAISVLIGVLGTIDGVWYAFNSIDILDSQKKQVAVTHGIAASLNPTAFGILIAILILMSHYIIRSMAIQITERIHQGVAVLYNCLVPKETYAVAAAPAADTAAPEGSFDAGEPPPPPPTPTEAPANDTIETAAVEDIKDEEEII